MFCFVQRELSAAGLRKELKGMVQADSAVSLARQKNVPETGCGPHVWDKVPSWYTHRIEATWPQTRPVVTRSGHAPF